MENGTKPLNISNITDTTGIIKNITNATNGTVATPNVTLPNATNTTKPVDPVIKPPTESTEKEEIPLPDNGYRTTFRMEGDLDSFAQYGGEEAFIKMLAEQLGIDPSYININSVVTGSVVIEFDIKIPPESGIKPEDIKEKQAQLIASGAI